MFTISYIAVTAATEPTKRNVVLSFGEFYDPFGFLVPEIIRFKRFFQKLCEQQLKWDEALTDALERVGSSGERFTRQPHSDQTRCALMLCVDFVMPLQLLMLRWSTS